MHAHNMFLNRALETGLAGPRRVRLSAGFGRHRIPARRAERRRRHRGDRRRGPRARRRRNRQEPHRRLLRAPERPAVLGAGRRRPGSRCRARGGRDRRADLIARVGQTARDALQWRGAIGQLIDGLQWRRSRSLRGYVPCRNHARHSTADAGARRLGLLARRRPDGDPRPAEDAARGRPRSAAAQGTAHVARVGPARHRVDRAAVGRAAACRRTVGRAGRPRTRARGAALDRRARGVRVPGPDLALLRADGRALADGRRARHQVRAHHRRAVPAHPAPDLRVPGAAHGVLGHRTPDAADARARRDPPRARQRQGPQRGAPSAHDARGRVRALRRAHGALRPALRAHATLEPVRATPAPRGACPPSRSRAS